jgi:hypothetical protein
MLDLVSQAVSTLFDNVAAVFGVPALVGTGVFIIRLAMLLLGGDQAMGDGGSDAGLGEAPVGGDAPHGGDVAHAPEPVDNAGTHDDSAFRIISLQSIATFLMGAGWGGIGAFRGSGLSMPVSLIVATVCGVGMVYLFAWLMKGVYDLQTSGNIAPSRLVDHEGQVDVTVPGQRSGLGTVRLVINNRQRMLTAVSEHEPIERGARVRVVRINPDNTVSVARV